MRKIRILHIQVLPILSGVQKAMYDILIRLDRSKYDITVLCQSEGELTEALKRQQIRCIILNELKREINPYFDFVACLKLYRILRNEKIDIIHTHSSKPGFVGRLAAKAAGIKCIVHTVQGFAFHEQSSKLSVLLFGMMERIAGLASDRVIIVNDKDRFVADQMRLVPSKKITTIYNGIDVESLNSKVRNVSLDELIGIKKNGALVGMVARLWKQKSPQDFIRSIPIVVREIPSARFLVIGDGPLQPELAELSRELGVQDNVSFLGWRTDVQDIVKQLDVMVLTSLWEGLPLTLLEGMALSKPIVATNIKGNNELVVHEITGFLASPRDYQKIGEYTLTLLKNKPLARSMGERAFIRVKEKFDIRNIVEQINSEYLKLLKSKEKEL
ncbi:MAG: glycosyltransferase family 4 protein [Candidatus Zhuqueibacterota bacterium]